MTLRPISVIPHFRFRILLSAFRNSAFYPLPFHRPDTLSVVQLQHKSTDRQTSSSKHINSSFSLSVFSATAILWHIAISQFQLSSPTYFTNLSRHTAGTHHRSLTPTFVDLLCSSIFCFFSSLIFPFGIERFDIVGYPSVVQGRRLLRSATSRTCVVRRTYSNYGDRCFATLEQPSS